jgi:putative Mg2+ transporter-C (MgtC) family protein
MSPAAELVLRILLGTALGAAIGLERDLHGRPAGLRTHAIVALASATFMVISTRFFYYQHYDPNDLIRVDPSRIASTVVSGIGFLGGGAILRTGLNVRGLTTAAGLWLVSSIGMAAGGGMYLVAVVATAAGLIALTLLRRFEDRGALTASQRLTLVIDERQSPIASVIEAFARIGVTISEQEYERTTPEAARVLTTARVESHTLAHALDGAPGIQRIKIERL